MAICLFSYLSFVVGLAIGLHHGRTVKRLTRLVLIRGRRREPRKAVFEADNLDDMEDAIISRFVQGELVPAELQCFDEVRRYMNERVVR
jgi:hypothetical protein